MKRAAFLKRMAFAFVASAFVDLEALVPKVEDDIFAFLHIGDTIIPHGRITTIDCAARTITVDWTAQTGADDCITLEET